MILGEISSKFENNKIVVFQKMGSITQKLREYTRIPNDACPICCAPNSLSSCHNSFMSNSSELIPSKLISIGFYDKQLACRLTEDFWRVRASSGEYYTIEAKILEAAALLIINDMKENFTHLFHIPSRENKKMLLKQISRRIASKLDLFYLESKDWINHDNVLHQEIHVRKTKNSVSRRELVNQLYIPKYDLLNDLHDAKILLIDDIVQTGLTMNRIGSILKKYGADKVIGFSWLRAVEDSSLFS